MQNSRTDAAILILSCDKFNDLWEPFVSQFRKVWPDCSYRIYLGANELDVKVSGVNLVKSGPDKDWSSSLIRILGGIEESNLLVLLEDAFPIGPFDLPELERAFESLGAGKFQHIHFRPIPNPDSVENGFGIYKKGAPYRANVVGFWNKKYLEELLLPGENPWMFEIMGSYRTSYTEGFGCLTGYLFEYVHLVEKGKWLPEVPEWNSKFTLGLNMQARPVLEGGRKIDSFLKGIIFKAVSKFPWRFRLAMMHTIRRILVTY